MLQNLPMHARSQPSDDGGGLFSSDFRLVAKGLELLDALKGHFSADYSRANILNIVRLCHFLNPRCRTAAILKIVKSPYLSETITGF